MVSCVGTDACGGMPAGESMVSRVGTDACGGMPVGESMVSCVGTDACGGMPVGESIVSCVGTDACGGMPVGESMVSRVGTDACGGMPAGESMVSRVGTDACGGMSEGRRDGDHKRRGGAPPDGPCICGCDGGETHAAEGAGLFTLIMSRVECRGPGSIEAPTDTTATTGGSVDFFTSVTSSAGPTFC